MRIEDLRVAILAGRYRVPAIDVADAILAFHHDADSSGPASGRG